MSTEFDRQVSKLIELGYPTFAGLSEGKFSSLLDQLRPSLSSLPKKSVDLENGYVPFVIVIKRDLVSAEKAMPFVSRDGKQGVVKLFPHSSSNFSPIQSANIPEGNAYLLVDIERGDEFRNVRPQDAHESIEKVGRSPLTIDEGIAVLTQYPNFLEKNHCFSLLASRNSKDKRVPAIWIDAQKQPNLGWCWNGNPHTWLGSASCLLRVS